MSRDYKKPVRTPSEREGSPMRTGIIIGLVCGIALSIGGSMALHRLTAPKPAAVAASKADKLARASSSSHQTKIEFYEILPGKKDPAATPAAASLAPSGDAPATEAAATDPAGTPATATGGSNAPASYYLQAGSFSSADDADNLKASLAMSMGEAARVQTVTLADQTVVHRVRLGPYKNLQAATEKQAQLASQHIEAVIQKAPAAPPAE